MAVSKKNVYVLQELDWLESKAKDLRDYVDSNPFSKLKDRIAWKETKNGGSIPIISSTIEQQLSALTKALKEYADIIKVINEMREQEEKKKDMRKGFEEENVFEYDD